MILGLAAMLVNVKTEMIGFQMEISVTGIRALRFFKYVARNIYVLQPSRENIGYIPNKLFGIRSRYKIDNH